MQLLTRSANTSSIGFGVIQQQFFHIPHALAGLLAGPGEIPIGLIPQRLADTVEKGFSLFTQKNKDFLFDQIANCYAAQVVSASLSQGALHNFLNKETLNFATAEKTFESIDRAIDYRALHLCRLIGEFEFPIQVSPLPALLIETGHHHLRKTVHSDFIGSLGHPLTPRLSMAGELLFHLFAIDVVTPMVTVAIAIGAIQGG